MEFPTFPAKLALLMAWFVIGFSCTTESAGTDVETQLEEIVGPKDKVDTVKTTPTDEKDTTQTPLENPDTARVNVETPFPEVKGKLLRIVGVDGYLKEQHLSLWPEHYNPVALDSIEKQWQGSTDSLGYVELPDSVVQEGWNVFVQNDSLNLSGLAKVSELDSAFELQKSHVFSIRVESEFIYGGGENDSAYFYVEGSPLKIQCGLEAKFFKGIPQGIRRIGVVNKAGSQLAFELPLGLADTVSMVLNELVLEVQLDTILKIPSSQ